MFLTKFLAPIVLAIVVSAAEWESLCKKGSTASMLSNNKFQDSVCMHVPLSSVTGQWGGGFAPNCNSGTYHLYWNISKDGQASMCYGKLGQCSPRKAFLDDRLAKSKGYDKCWSIAI
ncbi:hypothetical protein BGX28_000132 [Mortierella sp. GBA30]|nr:hypothetical protein BGX28_000132 [Mortierella sp. GBA30]